MQAQMGQSKKSISKGKVVLSLLLAVGLGIGGYFGVTVLMTGQSPITIAEDNHVPKSDLPVNENGDNIIGNSMQNLHEGGLIAMQGEDIFYVNPADGGSLYCRSRSGEITKLTDFAVANLNVRGEMLAFTDLDACTVLGEDGSVVTLSAATHEELWDELGENDEIRYGGRLYFITGVKSLCAGEIAYEDLTIAGVESEERYQTPVFLENGDILLVAASPGGGMMPASTMELAPATRKLAAIGANPFVRPAKATAVEYTADSVMIVKPGGEISQVNLGAAQGDRIQNAVAAGNKIFVETVNTTNSSRMGTTITAIDASTGKAVGTISGGTMKSDGKNLFFMNNGTIFQFNVQTGKMMQVSETPCESNWYELRPDGTVVYESKDTNTYELKEKAGDKVTMRSVPGKNGAYTTKVGDSRIPFVLRKGLAVLSGKSYYAWNPNMESWVRVDTTKTYTDQDGKRGYYDYSRVKMNWSGEKRDKGQNQLHWLQSGELGALFTDANNPAGASGSNQNAPDPAQNAPEPEQNAPDPAPDAPEPDQSVPDPAGPKDLIGTWNGTYHPQQGESGMTLEVYEENGQVLARWHFYSLPGKNNTKNGSVLMEVYYDTASGMYTLTTIAEDDQPEGYVTMSLVGSLTGDTFSGNSDCAFSVTKSQS